MSALHGKIDRRMLPRWKTAVNAARSMEFAALRRPTPVLINAGEELKQVAEDFSRSPNLGVAADVISTALLVGQLGVAETAAKFIVEQGGESPKTLLLLANSVLNPDLQLGASVTRIADTRQLLRLNSHNPMLWADIGRHHASLGDKNRAYKCMQTALQLAPNHRWMIRTMARFMVHQGDPAAAHRLLVNHPRTRTDPWLIAAELACAQVAAKAPKFWRQATDMLKGDAVSPFHVSELATAVAMIELEGSERKRARKYIQKGLISPTENVLAQIFWAKENKHLSDAFKIDELVQSTNDAYEADYQLNLVKGELILAMESAQTWRTDEPFASRPKAEIAYAASLLDDYDLTIKMADEVKNLDGQVDLNLEMNRIYAVLSSGKLIPDVDGVEIERYRVRLLNAIKLSDDNSYHAIANYGLWHYRYGNVEVGKSIYRQAIDTALKLHSRDSASSAAIFAAREAILAKDPEATLMLAEAKKLTMKTVNKASEFYLRKLDALIMDDSNAKEILSVASAEKFLRTPPVSAPKMRFEKTKNGYVIWLPPKQK